MSDDWVRKYIDDIYNPRQQEKQDAQKRRHLAEAGGPEKFSQIRERIEQDIQTLRSVLAFQAVEMKVMDSSRRFQVRHASAPRVTLDVDFDVLLVKYKYAFFPKEGSDKSRVEQKPGTLRISSDLDGVLTVYENGNGEAFADESEVSEFLLKPLLDHIDE